MTVFTRIMCPYNSWLVWILLTSWFPFRGYFFSKNNFLVLTFWNLKNQTPPVSRDAGKSCDWVKVKTKTRFKATFQIRIPLMIHNSLRLKRQEDIYKPRKTDSFCENFLIWVRKTLISIDSSYTLVVVTNTFRLQHPSSTLMTSFWCSFLNRGTCSYLF